MARVGSRAALQNTQTPQFSGLPTTGPGDDLARPDCPGLRYASAAPAGPKPAPDTLIGAGPPIGAGHFALLPDLGRSRQFEERGPNGYFLIGKWTVFEALVKGC